MSDVFTVLIEVRAYDESEANLDWEVVAEGVRRKLNGKSLRVGRRSLILDATLDRPDPEDDEEELVTPSDEDRAQAVGLHQQTRPLNT